MEKNKLFASVLSLALCLVFLASCRQQRVERTVSRALKNVEIKDYRAMKKLIGTGVRQDTFMFGIVSKMVRASYFLEKYHSGSVKNLSPVYSDSIDDMGRNIIVVPLYKGYDSSTGLYDAKIILGSGPFNLFSPDKLTDFEVEKGVDSRRRAYIIDNDIPTYDFDSVTSVEYKKLQKEGW